MVFWSILFLNVGLSQFVRGLSKIQRLHDSLPVITFEWRNNWWRSNCCVLACRCSANSKYSMCDWKGALEVNVSVAEHERMFAERLRANTWCLVQTDEKRLHDRQCNTTRKLGQWIDLFTECIYRRHAQAAYIKKKLSQNFIAQRTSWSCWNT